MCSGSQISVLIEQLRVQASLCDSSSERAGRVFAHEDENLSVEPVLLAQCVAYACSVRDNTATALAKHVDISALGAAQDLKQLMVDALALPAASVMHYGGAMRHAARCA